MDGPQSKRNGAQPLPLCRQLRPYAEIAAVGQYAECCSRSGSGGHGQRRGRVAAQYRLSAPWEVVSAREADPVSTARPSAPTLGRAIRLSSPHEAGGGTNNVPEYARGK